MRKLNDRGRSCSLEMPKAACRPKFMPQQTSQNRIEPKAQATVLRVKTASSAEKLKKTPKCSSSRGMHRKGAGPHAPVEIARGSQVPKTKTTPWKARKTTTPINFPAS